ncbi:hypothetical protein CRYPD_567 [uncultured Candidatus Thioglobus sp.]|nr:hypothetical protein CRYPD_567 [uncultured Candidatus Thioglobus sp.]
MYKFYPIGDFFKSCSNKTKAGFKKLPGGLDFNNVFFCFNLI